MGHVIYPGPSDSVDVLLSTGRYVTIVRNVQTTVPDVDETKLLAQGWNAGDDGAPSVDPTPVAADWRSVAADISAATNGQVVTRDSTTQSGFSLKGRRIVGPTPSGSDDTAALSAWMDACNTVGRGGLLLPGDYKSDAIAKTYRPDLLLATGARIIANNGATNRIALWKFSGSVGASKSLTADAFEGATVVAVNTTGLAAGDFVRLGTSVAIDDFGDSPLRFAGQQGRIKSVDSGTQFTLNAPLYRDFTIATSSFVQKVSPIVAPRVIGGQFYNPLAATTTNFTGFLRFEWAVGADVNTEAVGQTYGAVQMYGCHDFRATLRTSDAVWSTANGQFGYGVHAIGACSLGSVDVQARHGAVAFTTDAEDNDFGEPLNITVRGSNVGSATDGFSTHPAGRNIVFDAVQVSGCANDAIQIRARRSKVIGAQIERTGARGIYCFDSAHDVEILSSSLRNIGTDAIITNKALLRGRVVGNKFHEVQKNCIIFNDSGVDRWLIQGNHGHNFGRALISGNTRFCRWVTTATNCVVKDNVTTDSTADVKTNKLLCDVNGASSTKMQAIGNAALDGLPLGTTTATNGLTRTSEVTAA